MKVGIIGEYLFLGSNFHQNFNPILSSTYKKEKLGKLLNTFHHILYVK
jgi:hypothetical protein